MWKMFDWLWKAAAAALLASFLAIWTTGYIVNSYVEALLEEYEIPLEKPPFALSGLWGRLWGVDAAGAKQGDERVADREPIGGMEDARSRSGSPSGDSEPDAGRTGEGGRPGPDSGQSGGAGGRSGLGYGDLSSEADGGETGAGGTPEGGSLPGGAVTDGAAGRLPGGESEDPGRPEAGVRSAGGESDAAEESGFGSGPQAHGAAGEAIVSSEELLEAKSRLTDDERNRLFAILVGKVPQEEWQRISEFTEGGLTEDELLQVQQIVATYLDREEYDELMGILNKF